MTLGSVRMGGASPRGVQEPEDRSQEDGGVGGAPWLLKHKSDSDSLAYGSAVHSGCA